MPDLLDAMQSRRSIRKFNSKPVPMNLLVEILAIAGSAPSAHNAQPYRFIILEDSQMRLKLAEAMAEAWSADIKRDGLRLDANKRQERVERFTKAPVLILACTLRVEGLPNYQDDRRQQSVRDLAIQSMGAAIENLLLGAHAKGLGACWYAAPRFCQEIVRQNLNIPRDVEPQAFVVLGHAAEKPAAPAKKAVTDYCFVDVWGKEFKI